MNKKMAFILTVSFATSCSTYQSPESVNEKMTRYKAKQNEFNQVPKLAVMNYKPSGRKIASVNGKKSPLKEYTNKRVYFLSLLSQYNEMKASTQTASPEINHCPHFHTAMIDNAIYLKSQPKNRLQELAGKIKENSKLDPTLYPELALPVSKNIDGPTVADQLNQNQNPEVVLKQAYQIHIEKMYGELNSLCEYGQSDNYYIFENLVGHIRLYQNDLKSEEAMQAMMKTTIVSNQTLLKSLKSMDKKGRVPASNQSTDVFESEIYQRLDALWLGDYYQEMIARRKNSN